MRLVTANWLRSAASRRISKIAIGRSQRTLNQPDAFCVHWKKQLAYAVRLLQSGARFNQILLGLFWTVRSCTNSCESIPNSISVSRSPPIPSVCLEMVPLARCMVSASHRRGAARKMILSCCKEQEDSRGSSEPRTRKDVQQLGVLPAIVFSRWTLMRSLTLSGLSGFFGLVKQRLTWRPFCIRVPLDANHGLHPWSQLRAARL